MASASIISLLKYEHDFINPWVEYHIKLGFSHFYLLIDNIFEKQPEYIIEDKLKAHVTLINIDENDVIHYFGQTPQEIIQWVHASYMHHNLINKKIIDINIINEDWVTSIGVDQYIYLNGDTIQNYLLNINDSCTQIIFPWSFCCYNTDDSNNDVFLENIKLYKNDYGKKTGHSNGMIRRQNLLSINQNSHSFLSKTPTQQIFITNEYFEMSSELPTLHVFDICQIKLNTICFYDIKMTSFHMLLRNINEYFIKSYIFWAFNNDTIENNMYLLAYDIKNNTKTILNSNPGGRDRHIAYMNMSENIFLSNQVELKLPLLECKNTSNNYEELILNKLSKYNITKEEFNTWKTYLFL
jgi:hypothetical protein